MLRNTSYFTKRLHLRTIMNRRIEKLANFGRLWGVAWMTLWRSTRSNHNKLRAMCKRVPKIADHEMELVPRGPMDEPECLLRTKMKLRLGLACSCFRCTSLGHIPSQLPNENQNTTIWGKSWGCAVLPQNYDIYGCPLYFGQTSCYALFVMCMVVSQTVRPTLQNFYLIYALDIIYSLD